MQIMPRPLQTLVAGFIAGVWFLLTGCLWTPTPAYSQALNPNPPPTPVRLVFIHHSVGENWLNPDLESGGALFTVLNDNQYFVSDTYYGWGPEDPDLGDNIGSRTDIGNWYNWFLGPHSGTNLPPLYTQTGSFPHPEWVNSMPDPNPGGQNEIVMFKSCYPNSAVLSGNPTDPPRQSSPGDPNPIWGRSEGESEFYTVSNVKGMYRDLLSYFATRQDKLFILITSPPVHPGEETIPGSINLARAINTWLVYHWLDDYPYNNVAVFDFFNVLTSNGGETFINDLGAAAGNHHRLRHGQVRYTIQTGGNYSAYASGDSHPTAAGGQKATGEFVPLLNIAYHAWKGTGGRPWYMGRGPKAAPGLSLLLLN
ncbi:MAG: hypothetical protein KKD99_00520 [Proteobacteria bacterium]|nr:hypothetical protein [Pseudomonadota bacterium]MBU4354660.1 hypothetical protein [Pseudomonadota bacterium]MBU4447036.1 hypothetical protein [Pseudomonadota bacterium]MCG2773731.1 hypothetical protein [Desulfobacterales bacterium]